MLAQGFGMRSSPQKPYNSLPAIVKNYRGLLATRFFLGLAEAGIFPGSTQTLAPTTGNSLTPATGFYLISFWYKREESQKRFTIYWCSVLVASAFGGLLASAIANMKMVRGLSAWRWVFILEGMATILIGIASYFLVSDFPENAKWLTEDERAFVMARAAAGKADGEEITFKKVLLFFANIKHLLAGIIYFGKPSLPPPYPSNPHQPPHLP